MTGPAARTRYQETLSRGTVLEGRYQIHRICGQGGMSTVYVARDLRFSNVERLCAIKEMFTRERSDDARGAQLANFEREAALLATLSHPAIPKIYDFFTVGGLIYLVLEFIDGVDLERLIARSTEPVEEDTLIDWTLQILDVLSFLHEHQPEPIVFRDLKPSNIMLRSDGTITLIDFGIARTFQPLQRGTMIGTEGYAPPEQYRGIAEPRGDLYALGATLHHLSTRSDPRSEPPFTFANRPVRSLNPALSEGFEDVVRRAVAYAPADRFPSAAAMAQALRELRAPATPEPATLVDDLTHRDYLPRGPITAPAEPVHAPTPDLELSAERVLWSIQTGDEVRGSAALHHDQAFIGSYDQHLYALTPRDGAILWRFRANRGIITRPLITGDLVIVGAEDYAIYALNLRNGRLVWTFRTANPVRSSPAAFGDAIVVGSDDGYCYCLDLEQGNLLWRQRAWGPVRSSPLVAGDSVLVGSDDGSLYCFSAVDGRLRWRAQMGRPVLSSPAVSAGLVVVGGTDGSVVGFDLRSGLRRWTVQTQGPVIASPRIIGDLAIVGSTDGALYAMSLATGMVAWKQQIATQITSSLTTVGTHGYVGTVDGAVYCVSLESGETIWNHRLGAAVVSTPAVAGGIAVVGSLDGRIYGLRA